MRKVFQRVENNHMVPPGTPGHGFNGFVDIINSVGDASAYKNLPALVTILKSLIKQLGLVPDRFYDYLYTDGNAAGVQRDTNPAFFGIPNTANTSWVRVGARDLVLATLNAKKPDGSKKYPLTLQLNTLATKVTFEKVSAGKKPKATGIEYLVGPSVYRADPRSSATSKGTPGSATARKEVILAGGTFNSPQLLKLSGIGPKAELQRFNIPVVSDLAGVGRNLMDNPEVPVVGRAKQDLLPPPNNCTFGAPGDPCIALWRQGKGPYATGGTNSNAAVRRTPFAPGADNDMFTFQGNFAFRGFWPVTNQTFADPPTTFGISTVKMHNQNRAGTVALRSADPRDPPEINFNLFTDGADIDLGAILDTVKFGRRAFLNTPAPVGPLAPAEPPCSGPIRPDGGCDDAVDREWVLDQAFGHHPTSTCAIGGDGDAMAVLDSKFRVRGVRGLRVVDASAFPRTPGAFPVLPTYMLSVLAGDFVIGDAKTW
jgi:choline dehydrogenase